MSRRTLKLGAVLIGVGGPGQHSTWLSPEIPGDASIDIHWYIARAQEAEAAKFDLIFIVDSQFITADSPNHYLSRLEPLTLLSAVAVHTSHIGLVGTMTTSYNEPFNVARRLASLDHISGGRVGWNVVTSGDAGTADEQARAKDEAIEGSKSFERALAELGRPFGWHDFSQYDLDAPFPDVGDSGARSFRTQAENIKKLARDSNLTLRQVVEHQLQAHRSPFVGSPLTVANGIQRWFEAGAFDGINIGVSVPSEFARFTEQVLPILRERGVVRSEYEATTLRGNLGLPVPENRYTAARLAASNHALV
jgi:alkanesulfonate monooxygenase SsuD/methylene tetrahydromethanopterin reductase-like flavin-dependent oxidoreductase (luciferase family)